jgi:serine/threonine-protein kinase
LVETLLGLSLLPRAPIDTMQAGRYRLEQFIARGGMGEIWEAHDPEFRRRLAIKILKEEYKDNPDMVARFLEEAHVTGQLQHPGVPPAHEIGRLPDGRPFLAMKLIEGRTLADLLAERKNPSDGLPRFLTIFEQICQTVAYAHSRRIIHRDLKPLNVMVGAFGEVQVMDWGLAKTLAPEDRKRASSDEADRITLSPLNLDTVLDPTRPGQVMGRWAYMPPEQARGEVDKVDQGSDVFSLGATLCEILTGEPAYRGPSRDDLLRLAKTADLTDALSRLGACGADAELIALARKCLAAEMDLRPRDAGAVSNAVSAYETQVQERLRKAELERAAAEARAQEERRTGAAERRARRRTVCLAAASVVLVIAGGSGAWWIMQRQFTADSGTASAIDEACTLLDQAKQAPVHDLAKYREALKAGLKARDLAISGGASTSKKEQALNLVAELEQEVDAADRDRQLLAALLEVRGPREGPRFQRDNKDQMPALAEPTVEEQFAAAFREWDSSFDIDILPTVEAAARLRQRAPAVVMQVVAGLDEWAGERRRNGEPTLKWQSQDDLAQALDDDPKRNELRAIIRRDNLARERALAWVSAILRPAPIPFDAGHGADRTRLRQLVAQTDPGIEPTLGLLTMARALRVAGEDILAESLLRTAVQARPQEVVLRVTLGRLLADRRPPRWNEAAEQYEAARALRPDLGEALANALVRSGRVEKGLELYERLCLQKPDNPWLHFRRGTALGTQHRLKDAEQAVGKAIQLNPFFAPASSNLGAILALQGRYNEAEAACREALKLKSEFPDALVNLGHILNAQGQHKKVEAAYRKAIDLNGNQPNAHEGLGRALSHQRRLKEAEAVYREAIRLKSDDPHAHAGLAYTLIEQHRYKEAEVASAEALRLRADYPSVHLNLGKALAEQKRYKEAEAAFRNALRLRPDLFGAHYNLGLLLYALERREEALAEFTEAVKLDSKFANAHHNLAAVLNDLGHKEESAAYLAKAIDLDPLDFERHATLVHLLLDLGEYRKSETCAHRALDLLPNGHKLRQLLMQQLERCHHLRELDEKLPALLEGKTQPASVAERLELAWLCQRPNQRRYAAACRFYTDAFAVEPMWADDLRTWNRYNAAGAAALAGCNEGTDVVNLDVQERTRLRKQAQDWLRADFASWTKLTDDAKEHASIRQMLQHWQKDPDLAGIRDPGALTKLPAEEQKACKKLWADVEALLKKVEEEK